MGQDISANILLTASLSHSLHLTMFSSVLHTQCTLLLFLVKIVLENMVGVFFNPAWLGPVCRQTGGRDAAVSPPPLTHSLTLKDTFSPDLWRAVSHTAVLTALHKWLPAHTHTHTLRMPHICNLTCCSLHSLTFSIPPWCLPLSLFHTRICLNPRSRPPPAASC